MVMVDDYLQFGWGMSNCGLFAEFYFIFFIVFGSLFIFILFSFFSSPLSLALCIAFALFLSFSPSLPLFLVFVLFSCGLYSNCSFASIFD